ncbi:hypothetical protein QBC34DRAFT_457667 [Podospora aff. communis PSN243]|uniref:Acyl-CoA dehydrogenase n=1 Tax=Podospora aff. communis PSN243 TaxID=3040156 RepID=A0AAV9GV35_9PEZI|nr:hypothetical protein QBC34DRAFT_457667 [Podospora aff. communis PSN243]
MEPSSSNTGFIQQQPVLKNQFYDDVSLRRVVKLFLPGDILEKVEPEIAELGEQVLSQQIFDWVTDAEKNLPYLRGSGRDAFGKPRSELVVTEGWRKLQEFGLKKGFVAINYDTDYSEYTRLVQFTRCHLWEASCANTLCPAAMQDGATRLLQRHLTNPNRTMSPIQRKVLQNAYDHLISRDPAKAWTSGQWMTERTGGSDVSLTETVATYSPSNPAPLADTTKGIPLGPWSISGFKWFSSATDSNMTILLAKTHPSKPVSAFFAPMRRHNPSLVSHTGQKGGTELNGVTISRLKNKFGTQSLPTAELELNDMRGWLIGDEGKGIQEISTILNITRVHTTVSSLGYLGRGIAIAKSFALVREAGASKGKRLPLSSHPLHMRTLANLTVDYHAMMLLTFYTLYILGLDERSPGNRTQARISSLSPPSHLVAPLLRVLSSLHKSYVCENTVPALYACMEALGGVGYLLNTESEHLNVARIFRDACVGAIWEGTTDVLAGDTVRALKHPASGGKSVEAVDWVVGRAAREGIRVKWEGLKARIGREAQGGLLPEARGVAFGVAGVLMGVLFLVDVEANAGEEEEEEMCRRYLVKRGFLEGERFNGKGGLELDQRIVYGRGEGIEAKL